jgi:nucleoside phosphorylase
MKRSFTILVLSALNRELAPLCRRLRAKRTATSRPRVYRAHAGERDVFLAAIGIGRSKAEERLGTVVEATRPDYVLGLGFGGALDPRLDIGACLVCRRAGEVEAPKVDARVSAWFPAMAAGLEGLNVPSAYFVTVGGLAADPETKLRLGIKTKALVCDMETSAWVRILNSLKLPYAIVRAVSDRTDHDVTIEFARFVNKAGRVSPAKAALHVFVNPTVFGRMVRLWWTSRKAAKKLADFAAPLLMDPDWPPLG